jgi:polyphosphate kinase 2 (PPK2 family)
LQQEPLRRLRKRLDAPEKTSNFALEDLEERSRWRDYMKAYEAACGGNEEHRTDRNAGRATRASDDARARARDGA